MSHTAKFLTLLAVLFRLDWAYPYLHMYGMLAVDTATFRNKFRLLYCLSKSPHCTNNVRSFHTDNARFCRTEPTKLVQQMTSTPLETMGPQPHLTVGSVNYARGYAT